MAAKKSYLVSLDPAVAEEAKRQAKECGQTFSHVVEELLRVFIAIPGGDDGKDNPR